METEAAGTGSVSAPGLHSFQFRAFYGTPVCEGVGLGVLCFLLSPFLSAGLPCPTNFSVMGFILLRFSLFKKKIFLIV